MIMITIKIMTFRKKRLPENKKGRPDWPAPQMKISSFRAWPPFFWWAWPGIQESRANNLDSRVRGN